MLGGSRSVATLLATILVASPALAEPRPPSEKDKQAAGELVKKAIAKSQAGDHDSAIVIYLQAYTIVPSSALLSNIGAEYQLSGKPREALRYFCLYLEKDPAGPSAPYATTQARLMHKQLGPRNTEDDDACAPPKVEPAPPRPPPDEPAPPPPRKRAQPIPEPEHEASHGKSLRYAGLGFGIAGVVAAGFGLYEGVQAKNVSDEISNHPIGDPWPNGIREIEQRGQRYENYQIAFLITGGVLVTGGVVLFAIGRSGSSEPAKIVRVTPTTNGFAVVGRF